MVDSAVGFKSPKGGLQSAAARRISRDSNQPLQLEASRYNYIHSKLEPAVDSQSSC